MAVRMIHINIVAVVIGIGIALLDMIGGFCMCVI